MLQEDELVERLAAVQSGINVATSRSGRDAASVTLVAVSKTHPPEAIEILYDQGVRHFGESYVQEWEDKAPQLPGDIRWHFVGHLQSNKAKYLVDRIHLVHSVDRKSVMKKLNRRSREPVDVLLQVNTGDDPNKGGVAPADVHALYERAMNYPSLRIRGLMTIPPHPTEPDDSRPYYRRMKILFEEMKNHLQNEEPERAEVFEHLSMGMTADYQVAIEEGATIIRVGTALFGERDYS